MSKRDEEEKITYLKLMQKNAKTERKTVEGNTNI